MFYPCPPDPSKICIINSSHSFLAINLKLCTIVADILKIFEKEKIVFDKTFSNLENFQVMANTG